VSADSRARHFLHEAAGWTEPFTIAFEGGARVLADRVQLAGDSLSRRRGLLDRVALASGEGLIIAPTCAIHTFGMRFPIDVVFVDRTGRVLRVVTELPPRRVSAAWGGFAAVEVAAGRCRDAGLTSGALVVARPTAA
jgi:uncharacterized protein